MKLMPQEIEVRYVIPSLRKELSLSLQQKGMKQTEIAKALEITPAAVSQYLNEKRGTIEFPEKLKKEIKISSTKIVDQPKSLQNEIYRLTSLIKKSGLICEIHKKYDKVPVQCELCFYHENN